MRKLFRKTADASRDARATLGDLWPSVQHIVDLSNSRKYSRRLGDGWHQAHMRHQLKRPVERDDMTRLFEELTIYFQDLVLAGHEQDERREDNIVVSRQGDGVIERPGDMRCIAMMFENTGDRAIEDMHFIADGADYSSLDGLLRLATGGLEPGSDDQALALRIFEFVRLHRYHGPKASNFREDAIIRNPVTFFNWIGRGPCGHAASAVAVLAALAGLESRVVTIGFHTLAEINCAGKWIAIDADAEAVYRGAAGSPLGLDEMRLQSRELLLRTPVHSNYLPILPDIVDAVQFGKNTRVLATGSDLIADMHRQNKFARWRMMPGERSTFHRGAIAPWISHNTFFPAFSPPHNRGCFIRRFDAADSANEFSAFSGVAFNAAQSRFVVAPTGGTVELALDAAYPVLDVELSISGASVDAAGLLIDVRRGNSESDSYLPLTGTENGRTFRLRRAFINGDPTLETTLLMRIPGNYCFTGLDLKVTHDCNPLMLRFLDRPRWHIKATGGDAIGISATFAPKTGDCDPGTSLGANSHA